MTRENRVQEIKSRLGDKVVAWFEKSARRHYVEVRPEDIRTVTKVLFRDLGARFQIATAVDTPEAIEVMYHWAFDRDGVVTTIRVKIGRQKPELDSVADICVGTEWIEREMWELMGIGFRNHPDLRHLLLADDWPAGKYPLRRDYGTDGSMVNG